MTRKICKIEGCGARAWQTDLCNLHALERHRSVRRRPNAQRLAEGRKLLRLRARELGIVLADNPEAQRKKAVTAVAVAARRRSKVRSPVG